jgi:hypothetical protein
MLGQTNKIKSATSTMNQNPSSNPVVQYASIQAISEIGIGSLIHSLHLPLGGHFLSLNQIFCLTLAAKANPLHPRLTVLRIATVVACLKLFSPAGKRIFPMLAIFVQGQFFLLGIILLGYHRLGIILGAVISSIWAFIQPLLTAYLLFGQTFFEAVEKLWNQIANALSISNDLGVTLILIVIGLKAIIAASLAWIAWSSDAALQNRYQMWVKNLWKSRRPHPQKSIVSPILGAAVDLLNPLFLVAFIISVAFNPDDYFYIIRTIVFSYIAFLLIRLISRPMTLKKLDQYPNLKQTYVMIFGSPEPESARQ